MSRVGPGRAEAEDRKILRIEELSEQVQKAAYEALNAVRAAVDSIAESEPRKEDEKRDFDHTVTGHLNATLETIGDLVREIARL